MAKTESRNWLGSEWLWGLALFFAVVVTYIPVWWAGYNWDDDLLLTANPVMVGPLGLKEIWTTNAADICPLTLTTFWFGHALGGLDPLPYHIVTLLMHAANAVLLWRVLRRLAVPGAWFGAALWALHPVQVESVAWIAETKNTQSALFYLLAILFFAKSQREKVEAKSSSSWNYALVLLFAAGAMASKSSTIMLPLVLMLCAWWMRRRFDWRDAVRVLPIFLMSIGAGLVSLWTQGFYLATAVNANWMPGWPERIAIAGDGVWFYLGKLIWPWPEMAIYPRGDITASAWISYLPAVAVLVVLIVLWRYRQTWSRAWFFSYAYFLMALWPVLGLMTNTYFQLSFVADHFQYLAAMGPPALAGAGLTLLMDWLAPEAKLERWSAGAVFLIFLAAFSWQRAEVFDNEETLWTDTLAKNPGCWLGHNNLGNYLRDNGRLEEGIAHLEEAVRLKPDFPDAQANLGAALFDQGKNYEAVAHLETAIELNPNFPNAQYNLGIILGNQGRLPEAIDHFQRALKLNPRFAEAHNGLGIAYARQGRMEEAQAQFQEALNVKPDYADAQHNLEKMAALNSSAARPR